MISSPSRWSSIYLSLAAFGVRTESASAARNVGDRPWLGAEERCGSDADYRERFVVDAHVWPIAASAVAKRPRLYRSPSGDRTFAWHVVVRLHQTSRAGTTPMPSKSPPDTNWPFTASVSPCAVSARRLAEK